MEREKSPRHTKWVEYRRKDLFNSRSEAEKTAARLIGQLGYKTVAQAIFETSRRTIFADLYIPSLDAVVEIDGGYHNSEEQRRKDRNRTMLLRRTGVSHVIRLTNRDARNVTKIKSKIDAIIRKDNRAAM